MKSNTNTNEKSLIRRIKQHIIAKKHTLFLICHPGFESQTIYELDNLNIPHSKTYEKGGISIEGTIDTCFIVNVAMRTISRCLMRLFETSVYNFSELYRKVTTFPWELYIKKSVSLQFFITSKNSKLYHTGKIEEVTFEAIENRLLKNGTDSSLLNIDNINTKTTQNIFIRIVNNKLQCSLDTSGELLYKRGHRTYSPRAGLRETLAASILLASNIKSYKYLFDPMCGSAVFTIEALLLAYNILPNQNHLFPFFNWPCFKKQRFEFAIKSISNSLDKNKEFFAYAAENHPKEIATAMQNLNSFILSNKCNFQENDFFIKNNDIPNEKSTLIVLNPPYGKRITSKTKDLYKQIGETIKKYYNYCSYAIISPQNSCEIALNLPYDKKILFNNGGIPVSVIINNGKHKN